MITRAWLVGLVVLATIGFVIGTSIERRNARRESAARLRAEGATPTSGATGQRGETAATHAAETRSESHRELRPLGVDIEAVPFIVLAMIALAMIVLGALDVREALHQSDENRAGLVVLAAVIAALHLAAAGIAAVMARRAAPGAAGPAGAIPV